jgi:alkyl sulfatase BDS1-like metallo-beta-lactamase superfamily hydrolase
VRRVRREAAQCGAGKLIELLGLLDDFDPMFEIVAPKPPSP